MKIARNIVGLKRAIKPMAAIALAALLALPSVGCGYVVAGAAGAAGGYILHEEGYEVQSPIKKEETKKTETTSETKTETKSQ